MSYKLVVLARKDLRLPAGKLAAQVAHAAVEVVLKSKKEIVREWRKEGQKKVVLQVKDEAEIKEYLKKSKQAGLTTGLITDAGRTVVEPGTITCLGIGPDKEEKIDKITSNLKMY